MRAAPVMSGVTVVLARGPADHSWPPALVDKVPVMIAGDSIGVMVQARRAQQEPPGQSLLRSMCPASTTP